MKRLLPLLGVFLLTPFFLFSNNKNTFLASSAGTMDSNAQFICDGDSAFPLHNNDETLDAGDILKFVIHDNSGMTLGNLFGGQGDVNTAYGIFPGMSANTTYYISAVAGMNDGTGKVDLTDPELSVAQGTPVTFSDPITATVPPIQIDCLNNAATLFPTVQGGASPYIYQWANGSTGQTILVTAPGLYTVTITDANGCTTTTDGIVTVDVEAPFVNISSSGFLTCDVTCIIIDGFASSSGGNIIYEWIDATGITISTNPIVTVCNPGVYTLIVTNANNGCSSSSSVFVDADSNIPIADAGPNISLDCITGTVTLNGLGSSTGADVEYQWLTVNGNILTGESTLTPVVDGVGTYELVVTNIANGCTATDEVQVLGLGALAVDLGDDIYFDCNVSEMTLVGNNIPTGTGFTYMWDTNDGNIAAGMNTEFATVSASWDLFFNGY